MSQPPSGHSFIRPELRQQPGMRLVQVSPDLHRLQWNENPFDFPADLKEEVLQRLARLPWSNYPLGLRAYPVIDAIAHALDLKSEQVVVGNGSSDLLRVVIAAVLERGDHLVTISPTFGSYATHARQFGADVHSIALDPAQGFALPVDTILEQAANHHAKLIVICAPNNPTGTIFPIEQLRHVVMESQCLVFLDAAYAEFCGQDLRPLLAESDRVVIAHTLSKAYSLAGVRVGYTLSSPEIAGELQKLITNFTLSPFSESAAVIALENQARFQPQIAAVVAERERLTATLAEVPGVTVYPSGTNFLLVHLGKSGSGAMKHLRETQQVLIADMNMYPGYEDYIRISIGIPAQNDLVVQGLGEYLAINAG